MTQSISLKQTMNFRQIWYLSAIRTGKTDSKDGREGILTSTGGPGYPWMLKRKFEFIRKMVIVAGAASIGVMGAVAADVAVHGLRLGENTDSTRFVIDVDRKIEFSLLLLANPYRIVIDLPQVSWTVDDTGVREGRGLVEHYRFGQFRQGISRIVLDLKEPAVIKRAFTLDPSGGNDYRMVFDLAPVSPELFVAAMEGNAPSLAAISPSAPRREITRTATRKRYIVVDAGHGGIDPGAPSAIGVPEKTISLNMARAIRDALIKNDRYEVVMTRNGDVFVSLDERVEIARSHGADLFISVHADSLENSKVRGATVYTLSENASDEEARRLANKENRADVIAGVNLEQQPDEVASILFDLAQRETMNYSARFANYLIPELKSRVNMRKNPHRFAGFIVLKAPDVPSVLLEMGYLSNRQDARHLNSKEGREKISVAIVGAVDRYFDAVSADGH